MKSPITKLDPEVRKVIRQADRQLAEMNAAAHAGSDTPARFTLTLGEEIDFEFGTRAYFRMGTVKKPFEIPDCTVPVRAYSATVTWLWACLSAPDAESFEEPEDLAAVIPFDRALDCTKAFITAITEYNASRKALAAKSKAEPSPANG